MPTAHWREESQKEGEKKVFEIDMVVSTNKCAREWLHNLVPKVCGNCVVFTTVHIKVADKAIDAVGPYPYLEASFYGLFWEVLLY